jgi:hypothetical protein
MRPVILEIISKFLTTFDHCRHCKILFDQAGVEQKFREKEISEYPSDLREESMKLSDWIRELRRLYKHRLLIKLIDFQSPLGIYKSLRHRIRTYPTFIVEGKETYAGWDRDYLEGLLDRYMKASSSLRDRTA